MTVGPEDEPAPAHGSWGAAADVVGNFLLVFAFAPALAALPRWLYGEATNAINLQEPIVLMFLPVRGIITLLNAFGDGVGKRVAVGVIAGVLLCGWLASRGRPARRREWMFLGALAGAFATCLVVLVPGSPYVLPGADLAARAGAAELPIVSGILCGILCGMIAASTAGGLARAIG